jgi:hypothetical protein
MIKGFTKEYYCGGILIVCFSMASSSAQAPPEASSALPSATAVASDTPTAVSSDQSPSRTSGSTISQSLSNLDLEDDEADMKILDSEISAETSQGGSSGQVKKFPWIPPTEILPNLYLGSALSAMPRDTVTGLKSIGVKYVIFTHISQCISDESIRYHFHIPF